MIPNVRTTLRAMLAGALCSASFAATAHAVDVGTAFTYQGSLSDGAVTPTGPYDFRFNLFDVASGGSSLGTVAKDDAPVTNGIFSVTLDFGTVFSGSARWLQVEVREGSSTGAYTLLPRQQLTPAPYAIGISLPRYEQASATVPLLALMNTGTGNGAAFECGPGSTLNYGVLGITAATASQAAGVRGVASGASGAVVGVEGYAKTSTLGTGVVGHGSATGAWFDADKTGSTGVYGWGEGWGGHLEGTGPQSTGLYSVGGLRGLVGESRGSGAALEAYRTSGTGNLILARNDGGNQFWVDNSGVAHTKALEILGGADLSERFDVVTGAVDTEPGMVVCIDADEEGRLVLSSVPYDHRVAGIISGAGGVKPGMLMGQENSVADGAHAVALTGRVYVRATAANGPIEPGDLLTTSSRPGHAMRVSDPARAQGAIIGKAMGTLEAGEGLVLVLVGLQ